VRFANVPLKSVYTESELAFLSRQYFARLCRNFGAHRPTGQTGPKVVGTSDNQCTNGLRVDQEDKYLTLLRRELVRAQARLKRAERDCDLLREENERLKALLKKQAAADVGQSES
jgi:hypothetical protein